MAVLAGVIGVVLILVVLSDAFGRQVLSSLKKLLKILHQHQIGFPIP